MFVLYRVFLFYPEVKIMELKSLKCPNCTGTIEKKNQEEDVLSCPYCGATLVAVEPAGSKNRKQGRGIPMGILLFGFWFASFVLGMLFIPLGAYSLGFNPNPGVLFFGSTCWLPILFFLWVGIQAITKRKSDDNK